MADKLDQQVLAEVGQMLDQLRSDAVGDSPIERILIRALQAAGMFSISSARSVRIVDELHPLSWHLERPEPFVLIVEPQAQLTDWRVDFLIHAWHKGGENQPAAWRQLIVECDGHDFHERTKEQAARDRSRDRFAQIHGRSVLRFTGSEIHADPIGCALQVGRWAVRGWL